MSQKRKQVPQATREMLWGRTAGRCQFAGCNKVLWRTSTTKETIKIAEVAHIIAFSEFGPRGDAKLSKKLAEDLSNLMLLCNECHTAIDKDKEHYPVDLLREMKKTHEDRMEITTGVHPERQSEILLYSANIGEHSSLVRYNEAALAMFPDWYPKSTNPILLSTINSSFKDYKLNFWEIESEHLRQMFETQVMPRLMKGDIGHLSVFAIAPQPLLMMLGYLLSDIPNVEVYQHHRECHQKPSVWCWQEEPENFDYIVTEPENKEGTPALVLSLSADVVNERISAVLGDNVSIWRVDTNLEEPNNDFLKSRQQLHLFRKEMRKLMNRIKKIHGDSALLHVFPAAPVSTAVEFGRILMPKADLRVQTYDENKKLNGFIKSLKFQHGEVIY